MTDREKIIKALTICSETGWCENNTDCPYFDSEKEEHFEDCKQMLKDTLELLKEQEPKWVSLVCNAATEIRRLKIEDHRKKRANNYTGD